MEIVQNEIPSVDKIVPYIQFWNEIYKRLYNDQELHVSNIHVLQDHFAINFNKLRSIMDEDMFEWNHAMLICIVFGNALDRMDYKEIDLPFLKENALFKTKENETFSTSMLNLDIIQHRWESVDVENYMQMKQYAFNVHKNITKHFLYADDIKLKNRWNMMTKVGKQLFKPNNTALMYTTCRIAMQLQNLKVAQTVIPFIKTDTLFNFEKGTLDTFYNWARGETTYFSIRNFRNRILNIFWLFMNDEATRCVYTYKRVGEIPSIHSHVTSKYPQQWTSTVQHFILYGEPRELIGHDNNKIQDATLLALWEAHMKTIYGFKFIKFCVCMDHTIIKQMKYILDSDHPIILRVWHKWYLAQNGKIYKYKNLTNTLLAWVHHIHNDCDSMVLKQINLLKICKILCVKEVQVEKDYTNEDYIEVTA